jgi:arginine deiminase
VSDVVVESALAKPPVIAGGVDSEVGALRRVMVHRPGIELARLTPANKQQMLFDEVPWAARAEEEHAAFAEVLVSRGVEVLDLRHLLTDVLGAERVKTPSSTRR